MRALESITGHVIFKLRYDETYQMKTTIKLGKLFVSENSIAFLREFRTDFLEFHSKRVSLFYHVYLLYCRTSISHPNNSTNNLGLIQYLLIPSSLTTTSRQLPK